jgi:hypothetical protein
VARRDAVGDAAADDLVGQLAVAPLTDRSSRTARLLARQGHDLAHLLRTQTGHRAWSERIGQPIRRTHFLPP